MEFGGSLPDEEAQSSLDECYLALCDLARILNMDKKDISLGGELWPFPLEAEDTAAANQRPMIPNIR